VKRNADNIDLDYKKEWNGLLNNIDNDYSEAPTLAVIVIYGSLYRNYA